jgi:hypothetical protein
MTRRRASLGRSGPVTSPEVSIDRQIANRDLVIAVARRAARMNLADLFVPRDKTPDGLRDDAKVMRAEAHRLELVADEVDRLSAVLAERQHPAGVAA